MGNFVISMLTTSTDYQSSGQPADLVLVLISIAITLAVAFWAARRTIVLLGLMADFNREVERLERRTIHLHTALEMLAREVSEHLNTTHS